MSAPTSGGFTLVEMMVALVVTGILAAGVVGLLISQNAFYGQTDDRIYAEESLRATADVFPGEIRMASGADFVESKDDTVQIRFDVARAVVCAVDVGTEDVDYYVFDEVSAPNVPAGRGTAFRNPTGATGFEIDDGFDAIGAGDAAAGTSCEEAGAPAGQAARLYRRVRWTHSEGPPAQGAVVRVYGFLSYSFGPSGFTSGTALYRNGQELAAPFEDAAFSYLVCAAGCSWKSNVNDNSEQRNIRRVRLEATAVGEGANRYDVKENLEYDVSLRN